MNQLEAFRETLRTSNKRLNEWTLDVSRILKLPKDLQMEHLLEMATKVEQGGFSEAKMGRWLGWAQASCCAMGLLTLEECKEINMKWSDDNAA